MAERKRAAKTVSTKAEATLQMEPVRAHDEPLIRF